MFINTNSAFDLALWCGFLVAFYSLFPKANVVPKDIHIDPDCILTRSDIEIDEKGQQVLIYVSFAQD